MTDKRHPRIVFPLPHVERIDHRKPHATDFDGAEFARLGRELTADAERLAAAYPAPRIPQLELAAGKLSADTKNRAVWRTVSGGRMMWRAAAVLVCLATGYGLGAWQLGRPGTGQVGANRRAAQWPPAASGGPALHVLANADGSPGDLAAYARGLPVVSPAVLRPSGVLPAMTFVDLERPEQEAVLDLLEESALSACSCSL